MKVKLPFPRYKKHSPDGWPLCPNCGEDRLYSPLTLRLFVTGVPLSVAQAEAAGMECTRCGWMSEELGGRHV